MRDNNNTVLLSAADSVGTLRTALYDAEQLMAGIEQVACLLSVCCLSDVCLYVVDVLTTFLLCGISTGVSAWSAAVVCHVMRRAFWRRTCGQRSAGP